MGKQGLHKPTRLTPREEEISLLVLKGLGNKEIAEKLIISRRSVEGHLNTIYAKFGVRTRLELLAIAVVELRPLSIILEELQNY
ncbi:helix-turn-helix transcriptional regulator [Gloeocapsopsis dulcis]|uniref:response regulator transcription factor n=1 Tax=Gloeocapsopsis dulcis TaxID=2859516 RepID=UPI002B256B6B|nr:helix-turn-helix transcriptional regulator [Gloeocapsopsis dulcis]WNN89708.1 helix-turn-helix transcriptional regulator [Gloeocapsopsis dulcis]WNN91550.1 helix-turn-helix transcriptional regulator [Gloeocapsopsis dulcis]